jgi:hypothetical protein
MSIAKNTIAGILNASFYDVTEEYAQLLEDWYGVDMSLIDHDDEDLANLVWGLTRSIDYWRTNLNRLTPYEKLRIRYEALIEQHQALLEDYLDVKSLLKTLRKTRGISPDLYALTEGRLIDKDTSAA